MSCNCKRLCNGTNLEQGVSVNFPSGAVIQPFKESPVPSPLFVYSAYFAVKNSGSLSTFFAVENLLGRGFARLSRVGSLRLNSDRHSFFSTSAHLLLASFSISCEPKSFSTGVYIER